MVCVLVTIVVSYFGKARPDSELNGLVYGATVLPNEGPVPLVKNHWFWASIIIVVFFVLNLIFF
jgi:SSS family solute:Na+ symporter